MKTKTLQKLSILTLSMALMLCFQNCSEDNITEDESLNELNRNAVIDKLIEKGYARETIIELDDFYLVGGDLMFSKDINDYIQEDDFLERHAHTNNLVSQANVTSMTVFIDNSIPQLGTDNWRNEIIQAMDDWSTIDDNCVDFTITLNSNTADIIVRSDNNSLPNTTIASAGFPTNNQPHNEILINLDFLSNMTVTTGQKRYNMVHEFGHCIGFRHTNWDARGEGVGPVGANLIPGTPNQDPNSVMNGGTATFTWNGFSAFDIIAADFLYGGCAVPSFTITGASYACRFDNLTFTVSGAAPIPAVTSWNVSSNLQITSSNSTSVTVSVPSDSRSSGSITANFSDGTSVTRDIWVGKPQSPASISGPSTVTTGALVNYNAGIAEGATEYVWWLPYPFDVSNPIDYFSQNWQMQPTDHRNLTAMTGYGQNAGYVQVMGENPCGRGGAKIIYVTHATSGGGGGTGGNPKGGGGGIPRLAGEKTTKKE
ncbi:M57 family metalloprotease [uncultured Psychroserpens sp.]|uniref:M57 family metalloprotease n=1 Tax=uncultured Psychroserpens sp. TaxID=255436 RepID=UPI00260B12A4|nr:M57 family metalloprotease [uncultured Psychroserpens sp.]